MRCEEKAAAAVAQGGLKRERGVSRDLLSLRLPCFLSGCVCAFVAAFLPTRKKKKKKKSPPPAKDEKEREKTISKKKHKKREV